MLYSRFISFVSKFCQATGVTANYFTNYLIRITAVKLWKSLVCQMGKQSDFIFAMDHACRDKFMGVDERHDSIILETRFEMLASEQFLRFLKQDYYSNHSERQTVLKNSYDKSFSTTLLSSVSTSTYRR